MVTGMFVTVLIGFAVTGGLTVPYKASSKMFLLVNWLGAAAGALMPLLAVNCLLGLGFFLDPLYVLVQDFLIAGVVGGIVEVPLLLYRTAGTSIPLRQRAGDVMIVVSVAAVLLLLDIVFLTMYQPAQLPF